jgi:hypothetical protein
VQNLRWNEAPISILDAVRMMGRPERVSIGVRRCGPRRHRAAAVSLLHECGELLGSDPAAGAPVQQFPADAAAQVRGRRFRKAVIEVAFRRAVFDPGTVAGAVPAG